MNESMNHWKKKRLKTAVRKELRIIFPEPSAL